MQFVLKIEELRLMLLGLTLCIMPQMIRGLKT